MWLSNVISHHFRFVYVVTPKVACSSIKWALLPLLRQHDLGPEEIAALPNAENVHRFFRRTSLHLTKEQYERKLRRGLLQGYTSFSFVRNPWDRLVSCYLSKIAGNSTEPVRMRLGGKRGLFVREMKFTEFVQLVCDTPDEESNVHVVSQAYILCDSKSQGAMVVDMVGRFENLTYDFTRIMESIVPGQEVRLEEWNRSAGRKRDYRVYYSDADALRAADRYARDIELFGYDFDGGDESR